jgi:hypothetical protein
MKNLVINRKNWLRGEGGDVSFLKREEDGKMCCLGMYLNQCRVPQGDMIDVQVPCSLEFKTIPKQAKWMIDDNYEASPLCNSLMNTSPLCNSLMNTNDDQKINEGKREKIISEKFSKAGIKVTFV